MSSSQSPAKPRKLDWLYSTLPINIALGPIGTFVQLYLLQLNGVQAGTVLVAAAVTAFNAISIPAAIIWGFATDRLRKRKLVIVTSYGITTVYLLSFFFADSTLSIIFVYTLVSFISAASATPLNLLIMETEPKNRWATGFARLSLMGSAGSTIGYVISSFWVQFLPVVWLVVPLTLLSLVSTTMAALLIPEPSITFENEVVVLQRPGFFQRLRAEPLIFLSVPRPSDFQRIFNGLRNELTSYVPVLYLSIISFFLGSGIFNTSLVPALTAHSLTESEVYSVNVAALIAQILSFRYAPRYLAKRSLTKVATRALVMRGSTYAAMGVASLFLPGASYIVPVLILFPISSGIAFGIYYTAVNTMVFNSIRGNSQGSSLGVYSAVVGISTTLGSFLSGFTSVFVGFEFTFILAGGLILLAAFLTSRLSQTRSEAAPAAGT